MRAYVKMSLLLSGSKAGPARSWSDAAGPAAYAAGDVLAVGAAARWSPRCRCLYPGITSHLTQVRSRERRQIGHVRRRLPGLQGCDHGGEVLLACLVASPVCGDVSAACLVDGLKEFVIHAHNSNAYGLRLPSRCASVSDMRQNDTQDAPAQCRRCKRHNLRTAVSRAAGIGPRCAAIEAAFDGLSDKQADKARQLIVDGGVTRTSRKGIARVPSDETGEHYLTSVTGHCTCAWGIRRKSASVKTCYHVAVVVLEFTPRRPARAARFILAA
jgi:Family of unknown function (DUF6011)